MTRFRTSASPTFVAIGMVVGLMLSATPSLAGEAEERQAIQALLDRYMIVRKAADVDGISQLFHEDATIWAQNLTPLVGRDTIHAFMAKALTVKPSDISVDVDTMEIDGDLAFLSALTTMIVAGENGAEPRTLRYRDLIVLQKRDGQWRVLQDIDQPVGNDAHYE